MFEVIVFLVLVLLVFLVLIGVSIWQEKKTILVLNEKISSLNKQMNIAKRRFLQGKITKSVFDLIVEDLQTELYSAELALLRLTKGVPKRVGAKTDEIMARLDKPTKHKRSLVEKILSETELIREELALLESRLFKNEIKQSVYNKIVFEKEAELILKEKELMDVVLKAKIK